MTKRRGSAVAADFVSELIQPVGGRFDAQAMSRGLPGLPAQFAWRDEVRDVVRVLGQWKQSAREGGSALGELYLRRHYYHLVMSDASEWIVYFIRQTPRSGSPARRWYLYERR